MYIQYRYRNVVMRTWWYPLRYNPYRTVHTLFTRKYQPRIGILRISIHSGPRSPLAYSVQRSPIFLRYSHQWRWFYSSWTIMADHDTVRIERRKPTLPYLISWHYVTRIKAFKQLRNISDDPQSDLWLERVSVNGLHAENLYTLVFDETIPEVCSMGNTSTRIPWYSAVAIKILSHCIYQRDRDQTTFNWQIIQDYWN